MDEWPYDPEGEEGSEGGRKYGQAIIAKKIDEDEDFPLSVEEFVAEYGDDPIRLDYERVVALRDIFEYVEEDEYGDMTTMHQGVGRAMREGGFWEYAPGRAGEAT